jgi:hypothetical protein
LFFDRCIALQVCGSSGCRSWPLGDDRRASRDLSIVEAVENAQRE